MVVENGGGLGIDREALHLHRLLRRARLGIENFEAVVLGTARDEAGDVGPGAVALQLVGEIAQEAAGGEVKSVVGARQVDDRV